MNCDHSRIKELRRLGIIHLLKNRRQTPSIMAFLLYSTAGRSPAVLLCVIPADRRGILMFTGAWDLSTKSLTTTAFILLPAI